VRPMRPPAPATMTRISGCATGIGLAPLAAGIAKRGCTGNAPPGLAPQAENKAQNFGPS
jgi:hypothetical protein